MRESLRKFMCFKSILWVRFREIVSLVCLVYCLRLNAPAQTISFIVLAAACCCGVCVCECFFYVSAQVLFAVHVVHCVCVIQNELFMLCAHVNWIHQLIAFSLCSYCAAATSWLPGW